MSGTSTGNTFAGIVRDPVCGELIAREKAVGVAAYQQRAYYFCCSDCLERFRFSPRSYTDRNDVIGRVL